MDDWSKLARTKIRVCGAYRNVVDGIVVTEYTVFKSSMKGIAIEKVEYAQGRLIDRESNRAGIE